jgi:hypothetical protein
MSPFMSCGARLAVYALFAAAFFPVGGQIRAAIMPGTLQPKPTISGINALPDNPILRF